MNEGRIITGVDIGTSKIISVIAKVDDAVSVLGVSEVPSTGIRKGQIVNIEEAVVAVNSSIEAAERMAGVSVSRIVASIGGASIESQNSRGVVAVSQPEGDISQSDVNRVIDAAKAVSLPSTREIIHVLPRSFIVDGQEGIKDPVGMTGTRLEVETHIITAGAPTVRNLEKAFSQVGVDVDSLVFSGYSSSIAALSDTDKELGVVLVDIGAGTTDISIYIDGSVSYSSVLPIGARHITNDLAIGLRISLESAEKVKLFLSRPKKQILKPIEDDGEKPKDRRPSDEINLAMLGLPEQLTKVSQKTLVDGIIRPRLNEIFTMVGLEIKKSGFGGQTPSGLVITGGGARTIGAVEAAKRMLAMPVRVGEPQNIKGIIDEIQGSSYSAVIGLAIYGALTGVESSSPFKMNIPGMSNVKLPTKLPKKAIDFVKSFIP